MENYCQYQQRRNAILASQLENESVWIQYLSHFFAFLGFGQMWHKTFWGLKGRLMELKAKGQQNIALSLLLEALERRRFWGNHEAKWWSLMRKAVFLAQDLPQENKAKSQSLLRLVKLSQNAPQPWQGYDVAYCFATLSLWSFMQGRSSVALDEVNIARHADPSWAYPEYLLGWFGLWIEGIDPVKYFVRAIHLDWRYFQRLKDDPNCQQFPHIIHAVKQVVFEK